MVISNHHTHHTLTILSMTKETAGTYRCSASNSFGSNFKEIQVSGLARAAVFTNQRTGDKAREFLLSWFTVSRSPVNKFKVFTRSMGDMDWDVHEIQAEHSDDSGEVYNGQLHLIGLERASLYQVKVAAENMFGFNEPEEIFIFGTKGAGRCSFFSFI